MVRFIVKFFSIVTPYVIGAMLGSLLILVLWEWIEVQKREGNILVLTLFLTSGFSVLLYLIIQPASGDSEFGSLRSFLRWYGLIGFMTSILLLHIFGGEITL